MRNEIESNPFTTVTMGTEEIDLRCGEVAVMGR